MEDNLNAAGWKGWRNILPKFIIRFVHWIDLHSNPDIIWQFCRIPSSFNHIIPTIQGTIQRCWSWRPPFQPKVDQNRNNPENYLPFWLTSPLLIKSPLSCLFFFQSAATLLPHFFRTSLKTVTIRVWFEISQVWTHLSLSSIRLKWVKFELVLKLFKLDSFEKNQTQVWLKFNHSVKLSWASQFNLVIE